MEFCCRLILEQGIEGSIYSLLLKRLRKEQARVWLLKLPVHTVHWLPVHSSIQGTYESLREKTLLALQDVMVTDEDTPCFLPQLSSHGELSPS